VFTDPAKHLSVLPANRRLAIALGTQIHFYGLPTTRPLEFSIAKLWPVTRGCPRCCGYQNVAFGQNKSLVIRNAVDFGAESSRPTFSPSTLHSAGSPPHDTRLTSGLPATALTGLDFYQLDSFERFHPLIWNSPLPSLAWRYVRTILSKDGGWVYASPRSRTKMEIPDNGARLPRRFRV
jgi:hypothetical protein